MHVELWNTSYSANEKKPKFDIKVFVAFHSALGEIIIQQLCFSRRLTERREKRKLILISWLRNNSLWHQEHEQVYVLLCLPTHGANDTYNKSILISEVRNWILPNQVSTQHSYCPMILRKHTHHMLTKYNSYIVSHYSNSSQITIYELPLTTKKKLWEACLILQNPCY